MEMIMSYVSECVMEDLVGKTVRAIEVSDDQHWLVIKHDEGQNVYWCEGDCCSTTWVADIVGVDNLLGFKVVKAEDVEVEPVNDGRGREEVDLFYGIKLTTERGYVDIVYRNSSNGYYCGWMGRAKDPPNDKNKSFNKMIPITEDYSA